MLFVTCLRVLCFVFVICVVCLIVVVLFVGFVWVGIWLFYICVSGLFSGLFCCCYTCAVYYLYLAVSWFVDLIFWGCLVLLLGFV